MGPFRTATILILLGWAYAAASAPDDGPSDRQCEGLSVLTLNIYHDRDHWAARRPLIVGGMKQLKPDVIVLQEVLQHETLRNQAEDLAEALDYETWFVSADPPDRERRYGNAILTRHPVPERTGHRLDPLDDWRTLAHVRLDVGGHIVDIYGTHLHHTREGGDIRARQVRDLTSIIEARDDGTPSILMGDFNATVNAPELQPLLARYVDVFGSVEEDAGSITTLNPHYFDTTMQRRIDHIFAERGRFEILGARRVFDSPGDSGTWPSDHFGVYAQLCFEHTADVRSSGELAETEE